MENPNVQESLQIELTAHHIAIEGINDRILFLQLTRERHEQAATAIADLMHRVNDQPAV